MYPLMNVETVVVLFAIATIFGLVGVVVIDSILTTQEAEARGCPVSSPAANASKTRCFRP
jgi:hypothetical protein